MKTHATPLMYPTSKEEEDRWGFDVFKPKGQPMAWIIDWESVGPGFGLPDDRVMEVVQFKVDQNLAALTADDLAAAVGYMGKFLYHIQYKNQESLFGEEAALKVAHGLGTDMGLRGWKLMEERYGRPVPLDKIAWYQDIVHMFYGPDCQAYAWFDSEKTICARYRCFFSPPKGMEHQAKYCRRQDDGYTEGYMRVDPKLYAVRAISIGDNCCTTRCVHVWTYRKEVIDRLPDDIKATISETTKKLLREVWGIRSCNHTFGFIFPPPA